MAASFWEHLDELRSVLIRCAVAWLLCAIAMFCLRDYLFAFLFAPATNHFVTYRLMRRLSEAIGWSAIAPADMQVAFINTQLAAPLMVHIQAALVAGVVIACPYILYACYGFVAPALYEKEQRYARRLITASSLLFVAGVALNYLIIFPFVFRMLSGYHVYEAVPNQIGLDSYIYTLLILSLILGLLFELPIVMYFLAKMGLVNAPLLSRYRKHAFVGILILAAVITPTGDAVTLLLVTLPLYLLYLLSIIIVKHTKSAE